MTGFARSAGLSGARSWAWELKSVNGKGLDIRCRVPSGFDELEVAARQLVSKSFSRGNISISLSLAAGEGAVRYSINTDLLRQLVEVAKEFEAGDNVFDPPRIDSLL
ncbi:MAG: hypothetical protein HQ503_12040, partial [Rhodospirillales bacterium]|nr:hypothetical protein [Rhodospirillales bacterium]